MSATPLSPDLALIKARLVPPGSTRWDWHVYVYAGAFAAWVGTEAHALWVNKHAQGLDDFCHRTLSECLWAVFAMHPDQIAMETLVPFSKTRRLAWAVFYSWFGQHIRSNGREM